MRRRGQETLLIAAALLCTAPVLAQQQGADTVAGLLASMESGERVDLSILSQVEDISLVPVSHLPLVGEDESTRLDAAIGANAEWLANLRSTAATNPVLREQLEALGYSTTQIVGVAFAEDGTASIYIDDRP